MKNKLSNMLAVSMLLVIPSFSFAQAPTLGTAADFVLFTTNGAVKNTGTSQLTGNVGTNNGSNTGFGNVNGVMHAKDAATAKCDSNVLVAYGQLKADVPTFFPSASMGNGDTLIPGVYSIAAAATLNLNLYLNAKGNPNAVFVFQIGGPLSTGALSKVKLINGALACNVYWKVEGLVSMAAGSTMRGTIIINNAAINMNTGDTLEGRALSIAGAVTVSGILAYTPIGCSSPTLTGPAAPTLGAAGCYAVFSTDGAVTNSGTTHLTGDVGTNVGLTTGYNAIDVTGTIHPKPDGSTAVCASDLLSAYNYLNTLPYDIELLYPAQFGHNLVLTPHTYIMKSAVTFTDSLYLNAENDPAAIFVIQVNGAFATSTFSKVILINGAQATNVYWVINGAISINKFSTFNGTVVCNNGAINVVTGAVINGRVLTTKGQVTTDTITVTASAIPGNCSTVGIQNINADDESVTLYPNPFRSSLAIKINDDAVLNNCKLTIYNVLGQEVLKMDITQHSTTIESSKLISGIYFYKVIEDNNVIQSGKLISQQ